MTSILVKVLKPILRNILYNLYISYKFSVTVDEIYRGTYALA